MDGFLTYIVDAAVVTDANQTSKLLTESEV